MKEVYRNRGNCSFVCYNNIILELGEFLVGHEESYFLWAQILPDCRIYSRWLVVENLQNVANVLPTFMLILLLTHVSSDGAFVS